MIEPKIIVRIGLTGVESVDIQENSESEEKAPDEILERIQHCLDVADAILKKGDLGSQG